MFLSRLIEISGGCEKIVQESAVLNSFFPNQLMSNRGISRYFRDFQTLVP